MRGRGLVLGLGLAALAGRAHAQATHGFPGACDDDPDGVLASYSVTCDVVVGTGPCDTDMHDKGWPVAAGTTMADLCPIGPDPLHLRGA
jgi:hypothetical protein